MPVQITIGDWNAQDKQVEVDAFLPGWVVTGGLCTLTLTKDGVQREAIHTATTTPSATSCGLITIPRAQLTAGSWQAVVRFEAQTVAGTSEPVTVRVPA